MTFTQIINSALQYYLIINEDDYIKKDSIILKNSNFINLFLNDVNFTAECYEVNERLDWGFNVNSLGDYVVISPFKKRRE